MRLLSHHSREYKGKKYIKYLIIIPSRLIEKLGWDTGTNLEAEIKKGDIIQEINKKEIRDLGDFNRIASDIQHNSSVLLFINRSGNKFYVMLRAS